jgi:hypothetical protein
MVESVDTPPVTGTTPEIAAILAIFVEFDISGGEPGLVTGRPS